MTQAWNEESTRGTKNQIDRMAELGWYHTLRLPDGTIIPGLVKEETLQRRIGLLGVPESLQNCTALDIGCWHGWFSFELERRGAAVTAIDLVENENMRLAIQLMNSRVEYAAASIYSLDFRKTQFDIVLCLGVLYHLKHPLLALETLCAVTKDTAYIETYTTDSQEHQDDRPRMEFYERMELRGQFDNWVGPNIACVMAWLRTAGFAQVDYLGNLGERAHFRARRRAVHPDNVLCPPPVQLHNVGDALEHSPIFHSDSDPYVSAWCLCAETGPRVEDWSLLIGPYETRAVQICSEAVGALNFVAKLPPGLLAGIHPVVVLYRGQECSRRFMIAVDCEIGELTPLVPEIESRTLTISGVLDGISWQPQIQVCPTGFATLWFSSTETLGGIASLSVRLNGVDIAIDASTFDPATEIWQLNCIVPKGIPSGEYQLALYLRERLQDVSAIVLKN